MFLDPSLEPAKSVAGGRIGILCRFIHGFVMYMIAINIPNLNLQ